MGRGGQLGGENSVLAECSSRKTVRRRACHSDASLSPIERLEKLKEMATMVECGSDRDTELLV